jgi:hypothetical protein
MKAGVIPTTLLVVQQNGDLFKTLDKHDFLFMSEVLLYKFNSHSQNGKEF